jgi:hypothetical protein
VILGFRREVDENCVLLGCYAAGGGNSVPTIRNYRSHIQGSRNKTKQNKKTPTLEGGTDKMPRNVSKELPLLAA